MKSYSCDFETTTDENDCRVWLAAYVEVGNVKKRGWFNNIQDFSKWMLKGTKKIYFHNLKFDGEFIINYLFSAGYKHTKEKPNSGEFATLITSKGMFYSMQVEHVSIYDSLKVLPFSVAEISKAFGLETVKGEIDYDKPRPVGYEPDDEELDYVFRDVTIVAEALDILHKQGQVKMTTGSNALYDYKQIVGDNFNRWFPPPYYDEEVRQSYKGGWTYLKKGWEGKDVGKGIVLDVNSLYPYVMYSKLLPIGEGVYFDGRYTQDVHYPLYIQQIRCQFELKPGFLPTIQIKRNLAFCPTEYLESSNDEDVTLTLTNVDLDLFFEHYNVYNIEWNGGFKFRGAHDLFKDYIEKWIKVKNDATLSGNKGMRTLAKLMLNSLYGKFATNPDVTPKIPFLENGVVKYKLGVREVRDPVYVPMGSFITAYAREKTIRTAQKCYDRFIYSDTDSLHLLGEEEPEGIEVDDVQLGAWKHESTFERARFIRAKTYIEEINGKLEVTACGMPAYCKEQVTWENFHEGSIYEGKLVPKHVKGGIVLKDTTFKIKL